MDIKRIVFLTMASLFMFAGFGYGADLVNDITQAKSLQTHDKPGDIEDTSIYYYTTTFQTPVVLNYASIERKKAYIQEAKEILKRFRLITNVALRRNDDHGVMELGREANSYIALYVKPIVNDTDAVGSLKTKAMTAELQLLCAYLYYDLGGFYQAKFWLKRLQRRYTRDFLSGIIVDQRGLGFNTLAEGVDDLKWMISIKTKKTN